MSGPTAFKQDLPPPGGYKPIQYLRIPAKQYTNGVAVFIVYNIITFGSIYIWSFWDKHLSNCKTEDRSARMCLQPMIYAEKDRLYLKRCRELRDKEEELMKNVPGWKVGTYWGEPIYHTRPENEWHDIHSGEYFADTSRYRYNFFLNFYKYL